MQLIPNNRFDKSKNHSLSELQVFLFGGHLAALRNFNFLCVRTVGGEQCDQVEKLILNILCGKEDGETTLTLNKLY